MLPKDEEGTEKRTKSDKRRRRRRWESSVPQPVPLRAPSPARGPNSPSHFLAKKKVLSCFSLLEINEHNKSGLVALLFLRFLQG